MKQKEEQQCHISLKVAYKLLRDVENKYVWIWMCYPRHKELKTFDTKRAIQIYYFKKTAFTRAQVAELLRRNAEGQLWLPPQAGAMGAFVRADGGYARAGAGLGPDKDEYMFAILSGSERSDPATVKDRAAAEAELKELKGY